MTQPKSQEIFLKDNNTIAKKKLKFHLQGRNLKIVPALVGLTGIGKTAIVNQVAKELGYDAGFGPGKYADDVATFILKEMVQRGMNTKK